MRMAADGTLRFIEFPTPIDHSRRYAITKWLQAQRVNVELESSNTIYQRRGEHLREYWQAYVIDVNDEQVAQIIAALPGVNLVYVSDIDLMSNRMDELTLCIAADSAVMEEADV